MVDKQAMREEAERLMREAMERKGVAVKQGDTRIVTKPYGRRIWQSLPPMRRTRALEDAEAFFAQGRTLAAPSDETATLAAAPSQI